jgi:hypothetical protein
MAMKHGKAKLDLNRGNLERAAQYARKAAEGLGVVLAAMVLKPDEADLAEWADASDGLRDTKAALGDALTELGE